MIECSGAIRAVRAALANNPVCVLLGPRQCGKTTLARQLVKCATQTDLNTKG